MNRPLIIVSALGLLVAAGLLFVYPGETYRAASGPGNYRPPVAAGGTINLAQNIAAPPVVQPAGTARTAVVHAFTLQMPADQIEAIYLRHLDACARLGCTVVASHLNRSNAGAAYANASIRINPSSFASFEKVLTEAPAHIVTHAQSADDKAIAYLDLEKRIEAKAALRERLLAMLRDSGGKSTADLLSVERELTQVQGDIESATAQRDYLRTIAETVRVDIGYLAVAAPQGAADIYASRFKQTFLASAHAVVTLFAGLVTLLVGVLPWGPLIVLLAWGSRRAIRRWHAARA